MNPIAENFAAAGKMGILNNLQVLGTAFALANLAALLVDRHWYEIAAVLAQGSAVSG